MIFFLFTVQLRKEVWLDRRSMMMRVSGTRWSASGYSCFIGFCIIKRWLLTWFCFAVPAAANGEELTHAKARLKHTAGEWRSSGRRGVFWGLGASFGCSAGFSTGALHNHVRAKRGTACPSVSMGCSLSGDAQRRDRQR